MALLYLIFAIGFVSGAPGDHNVDCHHNPQQCIHLALVTTDPKECEHMHDVHCQDLQGHVIEPVCGSDQITYDNKCEFAKARCLTLKDHHGAHVISIVYIGQCGSPIHGIDPNLSADEHSICIQIISQTCTPNPFETICGSNGVTFGSFCEFQKAHCAHHTLKMSLLGQCPVASATTTGIHTTTHHSSTTTAHIISSHKTTTQMPVATTTTLGTSTTNGITATTTSMKDMIVHVFCQHLTSISCNTGFSVVCGSDNSYYPNECELAKASCSKPGLEEMKDINSCIH